MGHSPDLGALKKIVKVDLVLGLLVRFAYR
jgi:hypothetical protein